MPLAERAYLTYPTNIGIIDRASMQTEKSVDILYESIKNSASKKPEPTATKHVKTT
jgi:hypothetical protein